MKISKLKPLSWSLYLRVRCFSLLYLHLRVFVSAALLPLYIVVCRATRFCDSKPSSYMSLTLPLCCSSCVVDRSECITKMVLLPICVCLELDQAEAEYRPVCRRRDRGAELGRGAERRTKVNPRAGSGSRCSFASAYSQLQ